MTIMDSVDSALTAVTISKQQNNDHRSKGNNAEQRKKTITCNFCKKSGHIARFCFSKKRSKNANKNLNNNGNYQLSHENSANLSAFIVSGNFKDNVGVLEASNKENCLPVADEDDTKVKVEGCGKILIKR